ncbi:uncharacterized protein LOC143317483 [Chaetodon auriga]|uniref:uncharacterized protein LOC143317483 n=1 Tax=Chaetodon auriga TaxID=39042 RepID=UPI004032E830
MMNFTLTAAFILCSLSWISVSVSGSQTVEAQPGDEVTLMCANISTYDSVMFWFRLVNRTKISCISVKIRFNSNATLCQGFKGGKFEMRSNMSTVFLQIKQVDLSDSGQYFCGFYNRGHPMFSVIYLNIKDSEGISNLMSVILGALTVFLVMVIVALVVKSRKLQNDVVVLFSRERHGLVLSCAIVPMIFHTRAACHFCISGSSCISCSSCSSSQVPRLSAQKEEGPTTRGLVYAADGNPGGTQDGAAAEDTARDGRVLKVRANGGRPSAQSARG